MMLRIVATLFLVWTFGFGWFVATTPGPVGDVATDAVILRVRRLPHAADLPLPRPASAGSAGRHDGSRRTLG